MRLLAIISAVLIAAPGFVAAQSVLERVLGQIDGATNLAQVNGTYANIAESVSPSSQTLNRTETVTVANSTATGFYDLSSGDVLFIVKIYQTDGTYLYTDTVYASDINTAYILSTGDWIQIDNNNDYASADQISLRMYYGDAAFNRMDFLYPDGTLAFQMDENGNPYDGIDSTLMLDISNFSIFEDSTSGVRYFLPSSGSSGLEQIYNYTYSTEEVVVSYEYFPPPSIIDGSITNFISGVTVATQEAVAGTAMATEFVLPTVDIGDLSTTALGAVNTGDITLGVNSTVDEAGTSTTRAISAVMTQIGGSADTGALVVNVAHNTSAVNGSIQNTMADVNGSIGAASTTALGAVNTGTIVSGIDAAIQGIVGMSGQATSGL